MPNYHECLPSCSVVYGEPFTLTGCNPASREVVRYIEAEPDQKGMFRHFCALRSVGMAETLKRILPVNARVLDLGAESEHLGKLLTELTGAEVSRLYLEHLVPNDLAPSDFIGKNLTDLPYKAHSFDVVLLRQLHRDECFHSEKNIQAAGKVLKQPGGLLIGIPNLHILLREDIYDLPIVRQASGN